MGIRTLRAFVVLCLVFVALVTISGLAFAQGPPPPPGEVIIDGLNGPMGVLVGEDGSVYVVDSGLGGDQEFTATLGEAGPLLVGGGPSARVVKYDPADGSATVIANVNSYGSPLAEFSGGTRLATIGDDLYVGVSDWLITEGELVDPPMELATINRINDDGTTTIVFDSWAHERDINPYGLVHHAHPFGLLGTDSGTLLVADAGANALMEVDPATGEATVLAVMDALPGVFPRPEYDNQFLTDPVPTNVVDQDGTLYVSLLSGAPFVPGNARVVKVNDDGTVSDYATGLTMLIDLREGPDGEMYAVSFATFGEQGPDPTSGMVLRIAEGGDSVVVLDGLTFPSSIDFDADGNAYISLGGLGAPGSGTVVKVAGLLEETGTPYSEMLAAMAPPADAGDAEATGAEAVAADAAAVATAEPAEEAAAAPTESPAEEAGAAATETPAEEATAEEATADEATPAAPASLPVTGADTPTMAFVGLAVMAILALAAATVATRRRG